MLKKRKKLKISSDLGMAARSVNLVNLVRCIANFSCTLKFTYCQNCVWSPKEPKNFRELRYNLSCTLRHLQVRFAAHQHFMQPWIWVIKVC